MAPEANSPDNKPMPFDHVLYWKFQGLLRSIRKLTLVEVAVIISILGILVGLILPPVTMGPEAHKFLRSRPRPGNDLATVAAKYYWKSGRHGIPSLQILADGRFSYSSYTGQESGWVHREGDDLTFTSIDIKKVLTDRTLLPVRWGSRTYLIPHESLGRFCDAILFGHEPRSEARGRFLLAGDDEKVTGLPELPEPWASFLRTNIVLGIVIKESPYGRVTLDVGQAGGVRIGDVFAFSTADHRDPWQLTVISTDRDSCELRFNNMDSFKDEQRLNRGSHIGRQLVTARAIPSPNVPDDPPPLYNIIK